MINQQGFIAIVLVIVFLLFSVLLITTFLNDPYTKWWVNNTHNGLVISICYFLTIIAFIVCLCILLIEK